MEFHGKLVFLMNLTQTTNKELALALSVDPSLISLFRSGKRKQPQNPDYIQSMASFFAKRCSASFQRNALSEMLNQSAIGMSMPKEVLANRLANWLAEGSKVASQIFANAEDTFSNKSNELPESLSSHFLKLIKELS